MYTSFFERGRKPLSAIQEPEISDEDYDAGEMIFDNEPEGDSYADITGKYGNSDDMYESARAVRIGSYPGPYKYVMLDSEGRDDRNASYEEALAAAKYYADREKEENKKQKERGFGKYSPHMVDQREYTRVKKLKGKWSKFSSNLQEAAKKKDGKPDPFDMPGKVFPRHNIVTYDTFGKYKNAVIKAIKDGFKRLDKESRMDSTRLGRSAPRGALMHDQYMSQLQGIFQKDYVDLNIILQPSPKNNFQVYFMTVDDNFYCYIKLPRYSMHSATLKNVSEKVIDECEKAELQPYPTYNMIKATWMYDDGPESKK